MIKQPILALMSLGLVSAAAIGVASAQPPAGARGMPGDADGDGTLTKQEVVADAGARFDKMDTNTAGYVPEEEAKVARDARAAEAEGRRRKMMEKRGGKSFERLDVDGDARVTKEEMVASAEARFDRADANADGTLTKDEMRAAARARRDAKKEE